MSEAAIAAPPAGRGRILRSVAPLLAPALYVLVAWPALRENSATYDETAYVPAGFTYLARGDFRLSPEHPPLLKLLYALPLLPLRPRISPDAERAFEAAARQIDAQWIFGDRFLYRDNPPEPLLFRARLVSLALGALLALLVHAWAREVVGTAGALFASLLFALDPGFLAHGTLATTDVGATLFFFAALYFARRALRALAVRDALAAALCGGAAFASKFSAVLLVPTIGALALLRVLRRDPWPLGRGARVLRGSGARARWAILLLLFWGASCFGCLWACYGFRYRALAGEGPPLAIAEQTRLIRRMRLYGEALDGRTSFPDLASLERAAESSAPPLSERVIDLCARGRLLPEAYLYGLAFAAQKAQARSSYLFGKHTVRGSPAYFPVAFAVKTPLATLAALAAAFLLLATKGGRARLAGEKAFLLVPAAVVVFAAVGSNLNIGHRHLLPVYPFLFVLAGSLPGSVGRSAGARLATSLLLAGLALETGSARPWFLPFFNRLAGGAEGGVRILSDSNLDWGQALPALRRWMRERGVAKVNLCYFGTADPRAYGISFNPIPGNYQLEVPGAGTAGEEARPAELPGWIAIGATNLQGVYFPEPLRRHYSYLLRKRPVAILGGAIYVYWVVRPGE